YLQDNILEALLPSPWALYSHREHPNSITYTHTVTHTHTYAHIHTHTHTHSHTHTHTHSLSLSPSPFVRILVGAPRANSSYSSSVHSPGAVFKCRVHSNPERRCTEMDLGRGQDLTS